MGDNHEVDTTSSKLLREVRERQRSLWARQVKTMDVTPAMAAVLDSMDNTGVPRGKPVVNHVRPTGPGKMIRRKPVLATEPPDKTVGRPYGKRKPNRLNSPVTAPVWSTFLNKCMK